MTEVMRVEQGDVALRATAARWGSQLIWCAPAIFAIGAGTLATTRVMFAIYYPARFAEQVPTISETSSRLPGAAVFEAAVFAMAFCILVCWPLNFTMNRYRLRHLARPGSTTWPLELLNLGSCVTGMAAAIFLALLGLYRLHDGAFNHGMHIELSILFYGSQVLAFVFDGAGVVWQRKICTGLDGPIERLSLKSRGAIAGATLVTSLWFLYMYLDRGGLWNLSIGQAVYVSTEYTLALLCLAYPVAPFPEVRHHYRMRAEALSREIDDTPLVMAA